MGIEPTKDPSEPDTGFEDQGRHQAPITSATRVSLISLSLAENKGLLKQAITATAPYRWRVNSAHFPPLYFTRFRDEMPMQS